ncbi:MAG: PAS domain S-box protein, partial [Bacteroidetes bacterium]|nr:PAS domain S-box protein [Bacteroidota bacterium]
MKVSGVYVLVGAAWILVSGQVVSTMVTDVHMYNRIETFKGWGFVLVTGLALLFAVRRWASMIFHELNERRRIEAELREQEELYRALYDNSLEGILLTEPGGRILAANPAACSMLGRSENEILSGGRDEIVDTADPRLKELLDNRRLMGRARGELRFLRKDGTPFPAEVSSMLFRGSRNEERSSMVIHDISERREHERRFREMLEKINLIAITLDTKGRLTFCNDYLLQLTGWSRQEISGVDWFATFVPESSAEIHRLFVESTVAGGIPLHYENPIKTRTGNLRVIRWNNIMMRDERGQISGTASIGEDITERKQAEEEVRRSAAQLRALSNHLQTVRETERTAIAREIHDELGQSLTAIRLDLSWIQERLPQEHGSVLERCAAAETLVDRTIAAVQKISSELRP